MTRRTRIQKAHTSLTSKKTGSGIWFVGHCTGVSQSAIYRWLDNVNLRDGDSELLEGVLRTLEGDAVLKRIERIEAETAKLKGELT